MDVAVDKFIKNFEEIFARLVVNGKVDARVKNLSEHTGGKSRSFKGLDIMVSFSSNEDP